MKNGNCYVNNISAHHQFPQKERQQWQFILEIVVVLKILDYKHIYIFQSSKRYN